MNAIAAKLPSNSAVPLEALLRVNATLAELAFKPPVMVLVAPPLVLKVLVVLAAPIGLPKRFIVPPPLPPVKLKAVLFQRPLLFALIENVEAFSTLTLVGLIDA